MISVEQTTDYYYDCLLTHQFLLEIEEGKGGGARFQFGGDERCERQRDLISNVCFIAFDSEI